MATLVEEEVFEQGIYQLEMNDPVQGGPNGIDNLQAKQLANRTKWLKAAIDVITGASFIAAKAIKLATPRKINGVNFDGSADITISDSSKIGASNYASSDGTTGGTIKARINGSTLYITTNGNNA